MGITDGLVGRRPFSKYGVTENLIIVNFIVWLLQIVLPRVGFDVTWWLGLHYFGAESFKLWQVVTYMFLHGNFGHIFFNMFALYMFGTTLERAWGEGRFLIYYMVCGIGAGLVQELVWFLSLDSARIYYVGEQLLTIGASGAVFGLLLAFGVMFPRVPLFIIPIPFPIPARWFVIGYGVIELFLGVSGSGDGVAHFAHLGGMLFGFVLIKIWERRAYRNINDGWQDFY